PRLCAPLHNPSTGVSPPLPPSLPPVTVHTPGRLTLAWLPVPFSLQIERQLFEETVKTLNSFYAEAEKIGGSSYLEGCLACATAYFIFLCMETHYEKVLKKISRYIQEQNEKIFAPRGLLLTDPVERGMRVVSFWAIPSEGTELQANGAPRVAALGGG
uniref:Golgin subfamily A member 7/ERF4 domain-containing protein n=1 Tax=Sus scrofa TaxID=9823 RepID=A0A8D0TJ02_PIG